MPASRRPAPQHADPRADPQDGRPEATYSLGAVARLTGLSEHVLRAWERRHGAVRPLRTPGGTRRYRESDVERLRLLRGAVDAGHPIGEAARLDDAELRRRARLAEEATPAAWLAPLREAIEALDADALERRLGAQLAALGPARFVRQVASPLLVEVGERWHAGRLSVAGEHLASTLLRSLLGACVRRSMASGRARPVLFTTPVGERHELGALMAAASAVEAGGNAVFLGGDLPAADVARAARALGAAAVAAGVCRSDADLAEAIGSLRAALPASVELWIGGPGAAALPLPAGACHLPDLDALEQRLSLLAARGSSR